MANIQHVVVVMLENRSFDNIVGWLYSSQGNQPPINLPPSTPPTYDGLTGNEWNPDNSNPPVPVPVHRGTTSTVVPTPDPQELFDHMHVQIFQTGTTPTMQGFVQDYATVANNGDPDSIMECHTPDQVPVISALAQNYAICDRWFASVPCQTWPNRAFVHAGTSLGRVNNCDDNEDNCVPDPLYYDTRTIFNFLEDIGKTWKVYNDSVLMSLTRVQFITQLGNPFLEGHFQGFGQFKKDARDGRLPAYSFVEPSFVVQPSDEHPPHDVRAGERFLYDVWMAVSGGKNWKNTLLIVTYDEHGGCFDHVPPPSTAVRPDGSTPQEPFDFQLYGVRVPTVVVSPYIEAGTVFRSASADVEYDHTSILATLRDWVDPSGQHARKMPKSARIKTAPTLDMVLTRPTPRTDVPPIPAPPGLDLASAAFAIAPDVPLNSIQKAIIAASITKHRGAEPGDPSIRREVEEGVQTHADALAFLHELL
jgi:phospholipase C